MLERSNENGRGVRSGAVKVQSAFTRKEVLEKLV